MKKMNTHKGQDNKNNILDINGTGGEYERQSNVYAAEEMDEKAHGQSRSVDREVPKNGGETNKRRYETRRNTKEYEPSKILSLNAQGLIKTDTKWKVDMLKEYVHKNNIFLMNLTETWLKKEIQDEKIPLL